MATIFGRRKNKDKGSSSSKFTPELIDPDDPDYKIERKDLKNPPELIEDERDTVNDIISKFDGAAKGKLVKEREWLLCSAMRRGNQWVEWRDATNRLESVKDPFDPYRSYIIDNQIMRLMSAVKSRATLSQPSANIRPLTSLQKDVGCANECRDILEHLDQKFYRQTQIEELVDQFIDTGTSFLCVSWDDYAEAETAYNDDSGQLQYVTPTDEDALGDIDEYVVSPFEIFTDPDARSWEECEYIMYVKRRPLTYIQKKYGKRGFMVEAESTGPSTSGTYWQGRMDAIMGESLYSNAVTPDNDTATVIEYWERPSIKYPKGRRAAVANKVLLIDPDKLDWPYKKKHDPQNPYPFIPFYYHKLSGSVWGVGPIHDLVSLQRMINNTWSRLQDRINQDKPHILVPTGSHIGLSSYTSQRNYEKITFDGGVPPTIEVQQQTYLNWVQVIVQLYHTLEDLVGIHDATMGLQPTGITAGTALEYLTQNDTSKFKQVVSNIEKGCKMRAEWELSHAEQFYQEPRLIALSQMDKPQDVYSSVQTFENMRAGGQCRVEIIAGSGEPKTAEGRIRQWNELIKAGWFANPQLLMIFKTLNEFMGLEKSDRINQRISEAMDQIISMQPNPEAIEQQKAKAAQDLATIQTHADIAKIEAKAQADSQADHEEFERELHLKAIEPPIRVNIVGKLGGMGTAAAETMLGFPEIDDPAEIKDMNKPKPPMANGNGAKKPSSQNSIKKKS